MVAKNDCLQDLPNRPILRLPLASWVWNVSVWRRWLSRCWGLVSHQASDWSARLCLGVAGYAVLDVELLTGQLPPIEALDRM